jgi:MmeI, helicase spacer domain/MmeI, N-terminal domain
MAHPAFHRTRKHAGCALEPLLSRRDDLVDNPLTKKHAPRFVMSTDGDDFYCRDIRADRSVDVQYSKLNDVFDFFLPLAGIQRHEAVAENPADIKATARLANLYDAILEANPGWIGKDHTHELNLFMTRLLFCLFAEHTSIFEHGVFTKTAISMTKEDGSNTSELLQALFLAMDTPPDERAELSEYARKFPYVNGGLFQVRTPQPARSGHPEAPMRGVSRRQNLQAKSADFARRSLSGRRPEGAGSLRPNWSARDVLLQAAAKWTGIAKEELKTSNGSVITPRGEALSYASLAADAARIDPPKDVRLKPEAEWRYLGKAMQRTDIVAKSTGTATFGIDIKMPGMVYATVRF